MKFISDAVQQIRNYKGKCDGGLTAGGHCDLASMCSNALRAHWLSPHGKPGEKVVDLAFMVFFERAKQISGLTAGHRCLVWVL